MAAAASSLASAGAARSLELLLQKLMAQGPAAAVAQDAQGRSALHYAVGSAVTARVARVAAALPASVNLGTQDARSPLMAAAGCPRGAAARRTPPMARC